MVAELIKIFERDLNTLKKEVDLFRKEENLWETVDGITNSAGNLCLHLMGNLNHFIGEKLGNSGYVRDREAEFNSKNISRTFLTQQLNNTRETIVEVLKDMDESTLKENYSEPVLGYEMSIQFFLIHLAAHLSYHLGQINYLRRILEP